MTPADQDKKLKKNPENWVDRTNRTIGRLVSWLIPIIALILVFELIMRYIFNSPTIWAHEISQFLFGFTFMLGAGYTLLEKGHVNMDIFHSRFSKKGRARINIVTAFFTFLYLGVLVWKSGYMALDSCKYLETLAGSFLRPPIYPVKVIFFIGCVLFLLQAVSKFVNDIKNSGSKTPLSNSEKDME